MKQDYQVPEQWIVTTLGNVLTRSDMRIDPLASPSAKPFYIGLENIESHTGQLLSVPAISDNEIKSTKNIFHSGDILYGKLLPYLNKVYLAKEEGICSTDFWVFRAISAVDPEYVIYYL